MLKICSLEQLVSKLEEFRSIRSDLIMMSLTQGNEVDQGNVAPDNKLLCERELTLALGNSLSRVHVNRP